MFDKELITIEEGETNARGLFKSTGGSGGLFGRGHSNFTSVRSDETPTRSLFGQGRNVNTGGLFNLGGDGDRGRRLFGKGGLFGSGRSKEDFDREREAYFKKALANNPLFNGVKK